MTDVRVGDVAAPIRRRGLVLGDFELRGGRVKLRKTGNSAALDRALVAEVAGWLLFQAVVRARGLLVRRLRPGLTIRFAPDRPHLRYLVRAAATWSGMRVASAGIDTGVPFFFEDATRSVPTDGGAGLNGACTDIGKSRVARLFAEVFGYPLDIDPRSWTGEAVEKSEINGAHDGRIVLCPREPMAGMSYSRLIDTIGEDGLACDLRTHCVGRRPVLVTVKRRHADQRFKPANVSATIAAPGDLFSPGELASIARFLERMGADWCGLDILRDADGRIYIVDVNKTDAGPVVALSLRDKLVSIAMMARELRKMVERAAEGSSG